MVAAAAAETEAEVQRLRELLKKEQDLVRARDVEITAMRKQLKVFESSASNDAPNFLGNQADSPKVGTRTAGPEALKPAMDALSKCAAADAKFRAMLKANSEGDAAQLQQVVHRYIITVDALELAVGATGIKDKVKDVLRVKLENSRTRLSELQPWIERHGTSVLCAADASAALGGPKSAVSVAKNKSVPMQMTHVTPAAANARFAQAKSADARFRKNTEQERHDKLRAETERLYKTAATSLESALSVLSGDSTDVKQLRSQIDQVQQRLSELQAGDDDVQFTSSESDVEDDDDKGLADKSDTDTSVITNTQSPWVSFCDGDGDVCVVFCFVHSVTIS